MKYINALALAAIVAMGVSCNHSSPEYAGKDTIQSSQKLTLTASCGEPGTRTERATDGAVLWSPGDQISLFYGSGDNGGSCFTGQNTEPAKVVNFTGTIGVITGGNDVAVENTYFWAVYPYNPTASCNGSSITTILPTSQLAKADTFADDLFPSVGRSQGLTMGFYNICGGLKFTISEEGIKSVTLHGHNNEIIAGKITVGFDDSGLPVVLDIADGSDSITVSAPQGEYFQAGRAYYIVLVPTVFENGFTLTFSKGYARATYDRTKKTTIRRSAFGGLTTPDNGLEWEMLYVPIPDANFKAYMIQKFDINGDGELDEAEAEKVTEIEVETDNIESLEGIEYCKNLVKLSCCGTQSDWSEAEQRHIGAGLLTNLDLSQNTALTYLCCWRNRLTSLDLSSNTALQQLYCYHNGLTSLDMSANKELSTLHCYVNQLTSIEISANTALRSLNCGCNPLKKLDVSANSALIDLSCDENQLTSLDLRANLALRRMWCRNNQLTSLDVSANTALQELWCNGNQLTNLDMSHNTALTRIECSFNQLTSLDVSANTELQRLYCNDNQLASLDVSANTALAYLDCYTNQLTSLDVSANTMLISLWCQHNQLTSLNVSMNTALQELLCDGNLLTSLDLSQNSVLQTLSCGHNRLTSLDVSHNTVLSDLHCCQINDSNGQNLLGYLYIAQGQEIPNVTINRDAFYIPVETIIMIVPEPGGNEGTVDDNIG